MIATEDLLIEMSSVFPIVEMPSADKILFRGEDEYYQGLLQDIEGYRNQKITSDIIRALHQEMSNLSAETWRWILPYYLKYCLTPEAEDTQMETEFLIYALSPSLKYEVDTAIRLSALGSPQIKCLIHFIEWCQNHSFWSNYCPDELIRAKVFLQSENKGLN